MSKLANKVVFAGATYLDVKVPGWWKTDAEHKVRLRTLDIGEGSRCVTTQATGKTFYHDAAETLGLTDSWRSGDDGIEQRLGFLADYAEGEEMTDYPGLTEAWRKLIKSRRRQVKRDARDARAAREIGRYTPFERPTVREVAW